MDHLGSQSTQFLSVSKHFYSLPFQHWRLMIFAASAPLLLSIIGLMVGLYFQMPTGTVLILSCLTASASYIAAPAAIRTAIKEADIGIAVFAALGITFPLNVLIGIPIYYELLLMIQN